MVNAPNVTELELTFLAASVPDLSQAHAVAMEDVYFPDDVALHPRLRLRHRGGSFEITKKLPVPGADSSQHTESTIPLTPSEYEALARGHTRRIVKTRYHYDLMGQRAEIDVFDGGLAGLVLIDFEFESRYQLDGFVRPPECLADVTNEDFLAGGLLAGKTYDDIATDLARFDYRPIRQR
jgi:CYTH domain-containing protein